MTDKHGAPAKVSSDEVRRILGRMDDHKVVEIMAMDPTITDLEEVAAHLAQETDVMGEMERPLTGRAKQIFELIRRDEERFEEDR